MDPTIIIEVLTPDFNGKEWALRLVLDARPHIFNHNIETVERLTPLVRSRAKYRLSLEVLRLAKGIAPEIVTKSGVMLGLGETENELFEALDDLRSVGVQVLTMGQYLRPTPQHLPVVEYVNPETFALYGEIARRKGFEFVASGPLVRSSYHAADFNPVQRTGLTSPLRWCIVAVGKSRLAYARAGISEYLARLRCFCTVETAYVKPSNPPREGTQLLSRSEGCFRLILDESGKTLTSRALPKR